GGAAVLESLQAGRPVVAYASGFIPEIVRHEREGVLVPPGDVGALADALRRLATDAPLRARLAEGASLRAPEFTQERQLAALAALYARLAPSPRSG
ncbi:MAG TPA: glycosyltransferase, partial [Gemmatimonadaceae bacterium]|nr:glycosyltransferase [Gemmatimonadaceae bacterium]